MKGHCRVTRDTRSTTPPTGALPARDGPGGGSVLILALWSLFFLGALAVAVGGHVSAHLRLAGELKTGTTAGFLARAGVERAVMAVKLDETNNYERVFRDNDSVPGGVFSVTCAFMDTDSGMIATNYGVICESRKININRSVESEDEARLAVITGFPDMAARIAAYLENKRNMLAKQDEVAYPARFESLQELLLVDGVTYSLFLTLEPHVTVFKRQLAARSFGGVAEGSVVSGTAAGGRQVIRSQRIAFVFDREVDEFLYWHEF